MVMLMDSQTSDNGMDEWKSARDVYGKFDDRQHELRKYGFTFLSALIAADSLTKLGADSRIAFAIISITLLLTVALRLLDQNYALFIEAVNIRARILEVRLNLELSDTISDRYERDKFGRYVFGMYAVFAVVAGAVGIIVLYPNVLLLVLTAVFLIASVIALALIQRLTVNLKRSVDWSFDRTLCEQGEKVRIIATNLCPKTAVSFRNGVVWEVRKEGEKGFVYQEKTDGLEIKPGNNYSWELSIEKPIEKPLGDIIDKIIGKFNDSPAQEPTQKHMVRLEPGIYRVFPSYVEGSKIPGLWDEPLKRAIIVSKPKPPAKT
jgi:membrane protein implicated in regulation of membrane protease activity